MRPVLVAAAMCALIAIPGRSQVASGPGICFSFNDTVGSPGSSLPLVGGGELLLGFTAPANVTIERVDALTGFVLSSPMSIQVYPFLGGTLGPQIGSGGANPPAAGWIPLVLATPVTLQAGAVYVLKLTVVSGVVSISGDATQPTPLPYAFSCGLNPPTMFPPCSSYPVLGTFGARLRFRALPCGPTPLAAAMQVGSGCGATPAPTLSAATPPVLGTTFGFHVASLVGGGPIHVFWALGPATPGVNPGLGGGCLGYLDPASAQALLLAGMQPLLSFTVTGIVSSGSVGIPNDPTLAGAVVTTQALIVALAGVPSPLGPVLLTNALELTVGY